MDEVVSIVNLINGRSHVRTTKRLALWCVALLCCNVANARFINSWTGNGVEWSLAADKVEGMEYDNPGNRPDTTSVVFSDSLSNGGTTVYYNMTITGFDYTSASHGSDVVIPQNIGWDSHGLLGIGYGPVQYLSEDAFYGRDITLVEIPYTIIEVGLPCFRNCSNLTAIKVTNGNGIEVTSPSMAKNYVSQDGVLYNADKTKLIKYPEGKKDKFFTVPATVTELAPYCFANLTDLTVRFSGEIPTIDPTSFAGSACSVEISNTVTSIGVEAFGKLGSASRGIRRVTIPDSVTSIGRSAFTSCIDLTNVTIGKGVTSIGRLAFSCCINMVAFEVADDNPSFKSESGLLLTKDGRTLLWGVNGDVTIPSGVETIGEYSFFGRAGLTSVTIPYGVTRIETEAFNCCDGLVSVTIPDSVTDIDTIMAFAQSDKLASVTMSANLAHLGREAFWRCKSLECVIFRGNAPIVGDKYGTRCFEGVKSSCTAYVNKGSTGWGVDIPGVWNGIKIEYLPMTPVAADATPEVVTNAINEAEFADSEGVKAAIGGSAEEYAAFKAWAGSVKGAGSASGAAIAGESAVVANTNAAAAYLLGAERLFENAPKVEFEDVVVGDEGTEGMEETKGTMTVAVSVKDGEESVACDAAKVANMFEATCDIGDWDGGAKLLPKVEQLGTVNGAMRFKVTPGDGNSSKAFLRIRR